ncbi:hypothetical protein Q4Q34_03245 [Flavivirga abyssicola]|uniref:hypothetical protein n=1 Tax=Flavivirga abyssicola TaxID=3063533 RepID=UPI0026DEA25D|nr:hypothetical protein [Flavivirga sp. MEBiC07777]WVK14048.1 hypothetical protein Q4Q34_03245 [Flavivirga sp. MEBiC07777]
MENSFFVFSDNNSPIVLERFHMCTWEFNNNSSLIEFGFEISKETIVEDSLSISLYIPWINKSCEVKDLYNKLKIAENSRFIFNDSVSSTDSLDGGRNIEGVVHTFADRNKLCILPATLDISQDQIISATLDLETYCSLKSEEKPNVYFRFWVKPTIPYVSMRKKGIGKSTIIYDIKINEKRNIPDNQISLLRNKEVCEIKNCFSFNIVPNKYDILFFDNSSLKSVRTLEYESFNKYLGDRRVKKDELIVVFNKKKDKESYSFFSIYSKERIGLSQFSLAILINIICGILLFIPSYRNSLNSEDGFHDLLYKLPIEIYIAIAIVIITVLYFIWPWVKGGLIKLWDIIKKKIWNKK